MYLKKKQIHSNTKFNEYMYSANFQIHNQIHVFAQYMYLSPLVHAKPTSSPRPPLRCEEAKPTSIVKYNSNTSSIHTKCTPNTRTKYAIMEVLL